ncbi:hydantoinase/oxoprolinase family protein, partial [Candidatus Omnitrophota bacterium]
LASGPSAGPVFSTFLGKTAGFQDVISIDMGGTSFDVSVIPKGEILTTTDSIICDQRNAIDVVDVTSIGAGGGSIAHLDDRGMLCIGPESAGADPGPACYARGGKQPTVTDADLVLGYIPADYFLGGAMKIDSNLAEKAINEEIALPLGIDVTEAAYGIWSLLITKASHEVFMSVTTKGYDPRHFTLCVGGGAGPTHVFALAQKLGVKDIYIPKVASTYCAFGIACVDFKYEFMKYKRFLSKDINLIEVNEVYHELETDGINLLKKDRVPDEAIEVIRGADVQYFGQFYSIEASLPPIKPDKLMTQNDFNALIKDFHERHRLQRGYSDDNAPTEIVGIKVKTIGLRNPVNIVEQPLIEKDASHALKRKRLVYFNELGDFNDTPCYDGNRLQNGHVINGPAIVEEETTTIAIPPKAQVRVDKHGNYVGKLE